MEIIYYHQPLLFSLPLTVKCMNHPIKATVLAEYMHAHRYLAYPQYAHYIMNSNEISMN